MNEEQYRSLCEACDRVLLAPDSTLERVAIPWLHVIREHPVFLANYVDLFEPARGGKAIIRTCLRVIRNMAGWYRQIGRSLRTGVQPWYGPEDIPSGIDVLFVSHLLNPSQAGQAEGGLDLRGVVEDLKLRRLRFLAGDLEVAAAELPFERAFSCFELEPSCEDASGRGRASNELRIRQVKREVGVERWRG